MSIFRRNQKEAKVIVFFTVLKFAIHLLANRNFGFHRDELLYLALGSHPAMGYNEVPPFIAFISWLSTHIFGDSVFAIRLLPALFGSMIVYLTGLLVLQLGGKRFAISAACLGIIVSPAFLGSGYLLQPVVFDQFFWVLFAFLMARFVQTKNVGYLYWAGLTTGVGMLNKYTMLLYTLSVVAGILLSSQRRVLATRHFVGAVLLAFVIFLPNLYWQMNHEWPVVGHINELASTQLTFVDPARFLGEQFLVHATGLFIWLPGFIYLFFSRIRSRLVFISYSFFVTIALLLLVHGKVYYGFGAYPALFAAGGILWQKLLSRVSETGKFVVLGAVLAPSLLFLPVAIPILPLPATLSFFEFTTKKLGMDFLVTWEDQRVHASTQDYADMLGWEEVTRHVNTAYLEIPLRDRDSSTIFASNYGLAGAIDRLGKDYSLPSAVSLSSSYLLWAPPGIATKFVIYVSGEGRKLNEYFRTVRKIGEVNNRYAREKGTTVYLLSDPLIDVNAFYQEQLALKTKSR